MGRVKTPQLKEPKLNTSKLKASKSKRANSKKPRLNDTKVKETRLKAPQSGVTVRMYRQGLGDCFLLAFPTEREDQPFYMLIDCGVILGTSDPQAKMTEVATDIFAATGGQIHLLVITHEHWDHLSGFVQAREVFARMQIHNLWFAWTENPADPRARKVKAELQKQRQALRLVLQKAAHSASVAHINALLEFFGDPEVLGVGGGSGTGDALAFVEEIARTGGTAPDYREPGEGPLPLPEVDGVAVPGAQVYVLGPPFDPKLLKRTNPRSKEGYEEKHGVAAEAHSPAAAARFLKHDEHAVQDVAPAAGLSAAKAFLMAALPEDSVDPELRDLSFPFEERLRIPPSIARDFTVPAADGAPDKFFERFYGFSQNSLNSDLSSPDLSSPDLSSPDLSFTDHSANAQTSKDEDADRIVHDSAWRRIDDDWLGSAGEFALQLDSYTNNTSLALAIELKSSGKVLMMVADAQAGNWISWADLSWKKGEGDEAEEMTITDLLARTVLYKVGHHGSHNATMGAQGLELMTSDELVAMIPVDEKVAHEVKNWKRMPFEPITSRLHDLTKGRVLRVDQGLPATKHPQLESSAWEDFLERTKEESLFIEYTIADE